MSIEKEMERLNDIIKLSQNSIKDISERLAVIKQHPFNPPYRIACCFNCKFGLKDGDFHISKCKLMSIDTKNDFLCEFWVRDN